MTNETENVMFAALIIGMVIVVGVVVNLFGFIGLLFIPVGLFAVFMIFEMFILIFNSFTGGDKKD